MGHSIFSAYNKFDNFILFCIGRLNTQTYINAMSNCVVKYKVHKINSYKFIKHKCQNVCTMSIEIYSNNNN